MAKSAQQHLETKKDPKIVILDKDFAGIKKGKKMFVATPKLVDSYIQNIPYGQTRTITRLRRELARANNCDASCPVSTAIFIRLSAQAAVDKLNNGQEADKVTPFWRLLEGKDKIAKKLTVDGDWIDEQRESENKNQ